MRTTLVRLFPVSWRDRRAARRQEAAYRQIWQSFRAFKTVEDGRHDTAEWREHNGVFAVCAIRVPAPALQPSLDELRDALASYPFTRIHPDGFLHVMLQELGFVCDKPERRDEMSPARLEEFVISATPALVDATAFEIRAGGANAFQDAVFLDINDRGHCARLHARLREIAAVPSIPRFAFLPHTTVAHFTQQAPINNLPATIARWRDREFGSFTVEQIEVVALRLDEPYPPLETYAVLPLVS
ncbi:MAG: 2'-5' RNA ligase family protein [Thermomicrobiales bacterium]